MDKSKINKILLINFLTLSVFNMAHPVTPTLMNAVGLPTFMFGVLYSAMAIAQFVMSPVWGTISDMRGRKKVLIIGVLGYGISQLGFVEFIGVGDVLMLNFAVSCIISQKECFT